MYQCGYHSYHWPALTFDPRRSATFHIAGPSKKGVFTCLATGAPLPLCRVVFEGFQLGWWSQRLNSDLADLFREDICWGDEFGACQPVLKFFTRQGVWEADLNLAKTSAEIQVVVNSSAEQARRGMLLQSTELPNRLTILLVQIAYGPIPNLGKQSLVNCVHYKASSRLFRLFEFSNSLDSITWE